MKKSYLQSKKSLPSTKKKIFIYIIPFFLLVFSCVFSHDEDLRSSFSLTNQDFLRQYLPLGAKQDMVSVLTRDANSGVSRQIALLDLASCNFKAETRKQRWKIPFRTIVGQSSLTVSLEDDGTTLLAIETTSWKSKVKLFDDLKLKKLCDALQVQPSLASHTSDDQVKTEVASWLEKAVPSCQWRFSQQWYCELPTRSLDQAEFLQKQIRKRMIMRWKRQPFLLARRVSLTSQILKQMREENPKWDALCRLIKLSLPRELTLVMTSKPWQELTCGGETNPQIQSQMFAIALEESLREIEALSQLLEKSSKVGVVTVRAPRERRDGHNVLWVKMSPQEQVAENLLGFLGQLGMQEMQLTSGPCWHPIYSNEQEIMQLFHLFHADLQVATQSCTFKTQGSPSIDLTSYVAESVISESEFLVSNGRSKILRLPPGKYDFQISPLPSSPLEWQNKLEPFAQGELYWDRRRPRPIIGARNSRPVDSNL